MHIIISDFHWQVQIAYVYLSIGEADMYVCMYVCMNQPRYPELTGGKGSDHLNTWMEGYKSCDAITRYTHAQESLAQQ